MRLKHRNAWLLDLNHDCLLEEVDEGYNRMNIEPNEVNVVTAITYIILINVKKVLLITFF